MGALDECGVCNGDGIADGACDCDGNVDLGCGCGEAGPSAAITHVAQLLLKMSVVYVVVMVLQIAHVTVTVMLI